MSMRMTGLLLSEIGTTLEKIEESSIRVTTFTVQVEGCAEHQVMLRWDEEDPGKAYIIGITTNSFIGAIRP